tara:strand:+ start:6731 stop:7783 length:1053 start_codon:yes stop_codon:yes gene_type:complete
VNKSKISTVNNFDLLRLFAALQVAMTHSALYLEHEYFIFSYLYVVPGVPIFFFLSGYLIYGSYESSFKNSDPLKNFYYKRFLRLYPALWVCFLFSLGLVFISGYFRSVEVNGVDALTWVLSQLTFFQFYNPDFLRGFGLGALNGALWTVSVELQFYILFPLVYKIMQQRKIIILLVLIFFIILNMFNSMSNNNDSFLMKILGYSFAPWFYMFLCGAFFARFKEYLIPILNINIFILFLIFIGTYILSDYYLGIGWGNSINPISFFVMIAMVINLAFLMPALSNKLLKKNDISYGVYIFHMPIINFILYKYGTGEIQYLIAIISTIIIGVLSWILIERPALRMKINQARKI